MLYTPRTNVGFSTKFLPTWEGPFIVVAHISPVNYRIQSMNGKKTQVVHVQSLKHNRIWRNLHQVTNFFKRPRESLANYNQDGSQLIYEKW